MSALYRQATFMVGAVSSKQFPDDKGYEVAIVGRSNAGKSSAINTITGIRRLARTSKLPGRTRQINFFSLDHSHRLVDLPGYGYARVAKSIKQDWSKLIDHYLRTRKSLKGIIIIMDCRHPMNAFDRHLLAWCRMSRLPAHILLNKSDKLSRGAAASTLHKIRNTLATEFKKDHSFVTVQLFSALKEIGVDEIHMKLSGWLDLEAKKSLRG